ncbi:MAG: sigma-70 family RNA polymerase sigma factor [Planctomycetes bacterium]|nr:sigma-70 family RNA polymerase sigma factor [Planctomycetota bacterium]
MDSPEVDSVAMPPPWGEHVLALRRLSAGLARREDARDDLVQDTLLRALLAPPPTLSWRWLAATLRRRSIDHARRAERRERHELATEPDPVAPSAEDIALQLELQSELNAAVRALREPYQRVVYLRFIEDRTPTEIAHALGVPVKTIKTQLARGLAELRERLERRYGRGLPGLALLLPSTTAPSAAAGFAGLFVMLKKVASSIAVLVALLGLWYTLSSAPPASSEPAQVADARGELPSRGERELSLAATSDEARRSAGDAPAVAAPSAPGTSELRVTVRWSDGTPASKVGVRIFSAATRRPLGGEGLLESDGGGVARFARAPNEPLFVRADRGTEVGPVAPATHGDDVREVELALEPGVAVQGRVVDPRGVGLAGAEIVLASGGSDWLSVDRLARSGPDGGFELRDVPRRLSLVALAAGFAPSEPEDLELATGEPPFRLELELTKEGGDLIGQVVQAGGAPVPFAWVALVRIERWTPRFDGTMAEALGPRALPCDFEGRFRFEGVDAGTWPLHVCAPGFALATTTASIERGRTSEVQVELVRGGELQGTVRDAEGRPVAGAFVRAFDAAVSPRYLGMGQYDERNAFGSPTTSSDAEGRYRLGPLWPDEVHVYASSPRGDDQHVDQRELRAEIVLQPRAGEVLAWDPVLAPGPTIRGRVIYADGTPMKDTFVDAKPSDPTQTRTAYTDETGEFVFHNLTVEAHRIDVQLWADGGAIAPLFREDVWPDGAPLELRAERVAPEQQPKGSVRGRVVGADGQVAEGTGVGLSASDGLTYFATEYSQGEFRFDGLPKETYRVVVFRGDDVVHVAEAFELGSGEERDVGALRLGPDASLRVRIDRSRIGAELEPSLYLRREGSMIGRNLAPGTSEFVSIDRLTVGTYGIHWWGAGLAEGERTVDLAAEREVVLSLEPGWLHTFEIAFPAGAAGELELVVSKPDGTTVLRNVLARGWNVMNPFAFGPMLPAGSYRVTAKTDQGLAAAADFVVLAESSNPTTRIELK